MINVHVSKIHTRETGGGGKGERWRHTQTHMYNVLTGKNSF